MKTIILSITLLGINLFGFSQDNYLSYGEKVNPDSAVSVQTALHALENARAFVVNDITIEGSINATCAKKGCWMTMPISDKKEMRVTFKDYGFFVPREGVEGNTTFIHGTIKKEIIDVSTLKHYAMDAGKTEAEIEAIDEPVEEITFVANGVLIAKE